MPSFSVNPEYSIYSVIVYANGQHTLSIIHTEYTIHQQKTFLSRRNGCISNDPNFRLKHTGVLDGSDGSDGTSHARTETYMLPVAQATGRVA